MLEGKLSYRVEDPFIALELLRICKFKLRKEKDINSTCQSLQRPFKTFHRKNRSPNQKQFSVASSNIAGNHYLG